jgi:hypothetical protein
MKKAMAKAPRLAARPFVFMALILVVSAYAKNDMAPADSNAQIARHETEAGAVPWAPHEFHDGNVKACVERYFGKSADELTSEDFKALAGLRAFSFDAYSMPVTSLRDLPELFPSLRFAGLSFAWFDGAQLSSGDLAVLEEMKSLRAVDIYADGLPSFGFAEGLPYVSLRYTEEACSPEGNNLAEASVFGKEFIESQFAGHVREYVRVVSGNRAYELICTDRNIGQFGEFAAQYEAKLFVSGSIDDEYPPPERLDVPNRAGNASGGLLVADVDFDGQNDILVLAGRFGTQGAAGYNCFLARGNGFEPCESFLEIRNPAIDKENKKVLGVWRNWAASHSWAMYSFESGEFVMTDILTEEPEERGDAAPGGYGPDVCPWKYTVGKIINGTGEWETEIYSTRDYTDGEIHAMFAAEDSFWARTSSKWHTLADMSSYYGGWNGQEFHSEGLDAQIAETIGQ